MNFISRLLRYFFDGVQIKGSFAQNLAISFSGNAVAQVIGFAFTPFIARFYGPEVYGIFSLYISIVNTASALSTLQLPPGFVVANSQEEFQRLLRISVIVLLGFTLLFTAFVLFLSSAVLSYFEIEELGDYIFLFPVYILLMGIDYLLLGWNIREKEFRRAAFSKLIAIFGSKLFTLVYAFWGGPWAMGMIVGNLILYPINSLGLFTGRIASTFSGVWVKSSTDKLAATWKKFKDYPLYATPGLLLAGLNMQLPIYFFSSFFNATSAGHFALANGVISAPLSILVNSANVVFLQKAAETHQNSPHLLGEVVLKLYKRMTLVAVPALLALGFCSKWLFTLVFGSQWQPAGAMAAFVALSAMYIVNGPLSFIFRIAGRQRLDFQLKLIFIFAETLALIPGLYYNDIILSVIGYSFVSWLCSWISLMFVFKLVDLNPKILLRDAGIGVVIFIVAIYFFYK